MCGIYVKVGNQSSELSQTKLAVANSRGSDNSQVVRVHPEVTLGHNRLAILDLDDRSHQPYSYAHLTIVHNGEIYNFRELRGELEKRGYKFNTESDTEVICAAYLDYGTKMPEYLNGMFAFVIYDSKNHCLFGARDRTGQKPLFYSRKDGFEAASLSSQIAHGGKYEQSREAVQQYLRWAYVPESLCIYRDIHKLAAAHFFEYDISSDHFTSEPYWRMDLNQTSYNGTYDDAVEELNTLLIDSVDKRKLSDVPLGVFLSGGIDSSLISAMASSTDTIKTFAIKFESSKYDESDYARKVADKLETAHHEFICGDAESQEIISSINEHFDEPFADSSAIPTLFLSKETKKHVSVALSGDGADELFLGYNRYARMNALKGVYSIPYAVRKLASSLLAQIPSKQSYIKSKGLKFRSLEELHCQKMCLMDDRALLPDSLANQKERVKYLESNRDFLSRLSDFDIASYLVSDINTKVDRASMAHTLEVRSPFLDHRVIEFARNLPIHYKINSGDKKKIIKDILYKYLPEELFQRPKQGFRAPISGWISGSLREYVRDTIHKESLNKIPEVIPSVALKQMEDHLQGKEDNSLLIWRLMVLIDWNKKHGI